MKIAWEFGSILCIILTNDFTVSQNRYACGKSDYTASMGYRSSLCMRNVNYKHIHHSVLNHCFLTPCRCYWREKKENRMKTRNVSLCLYDADTPPHHFSTLVTKFLDRRTHRCLCWSFVIAGSLRIVVVRLGILISDYKKVIESIQRDRKYNLFYGILTYLPARMTSLCYERNQYSSWINCECREVVTFILKIKRVKLVITNMKFLFSVQMSDK